MDGLRYRWLWTWDNRMAWHLEKPTIRCQKGGIVQRPYQKSKEAFRLDYMRLVDYASEHRFNGIVIAGFLRDAHGGTKDSKLLCRYAEEKGVGIMPLVGTYHYGGYYWEGDHQYNLSTFLQRHPDLRAEDKDGKRIEAICPSGEGWRKWLRKGMKWLYETFSIRGVNIESNEDMLCCCKDCRTAREEWGREDPELIKTDFLTIKPAVETALEIDPSSWVSYATYMGFNGGIIESPPKFVGLLPDKAIAQWTLTNMLDEWPKGAKPPTKRSTGLGHYGRNSGNGWMPKNGKIQSQFSVASIRNLCRRSIESGLEGALIYGECPDSRINNEANYLAFEEFSSNSHGSLESFAKKRLTSLYGSEDLALDAIKIMLSEETQLSNARKIKESLKIARMRLRTVSDVRARKRWGQLTSILEKTVIR